MNNNKMPWRQEAIETFSDLIARIRDFDAFATISFNKMGPRWNMEMSIPEEGKIEEAECRFE